MPNEWMVQLTLGNDECLYWKPSKFPNHKLCSSPSSKILFCQYEYCPHKLPATEEEANE